MNSIQSIFRRKKVIPGALEPFGFCRVNNAYIYRKILQGSGFEMTVTVAGDGKVTATVLDPALHEPYTLHLADGAAGSFVGGIRTEYERILTEISGKCFEPDVFKSSQAKALIQYVRESHGDELEFLWERFPDNAVWRRADTAKWYGALLTVPKRKLGVALDELAEIVDLRLAPEHMAALVDHKTYFPGWHMNKKSWYTVILDGSVPLSELQRRVEESYRLATK